MEVGNAFVTVAPSAKGFGRSLDSQLGGQVKSSGSRAGRLFGGALKVGALAALGGAAVAAGFLKGSLDEAREAQKVGAQTNAVIKSTGGVANVTAKSVGSLSTAISQKAGIDDEAIQSGANLLLTFTNIRNEAGKGNKVFDQTTQAAVDMSVALGTDTKSAALQLGKALNDPEKGVTKLTRSGVTFTDAQKEQIKTLQDSGDMLGAQKIILAEVNKEFGGSAAATATAGDKFKVAFGNLQESVGTALLPVLDKGLTAATKFIGFLTENTGPAFAAISAFVAPAVAALQGFFSSLSGAGGGGALSGFLATIKAIGASVAANFLPVLRTMATTFTTLILPVILRVATYIATNLMPIFTKVGTIIATQVVPILATLAQFIYGTLVPAIVKIVTSIAGSLKPVFDALFAQIQATVLPIVTKLLEKFREWWPTISKVILIVLRVIGVVLRLAAAILGKVLPPLIRFAGFLIRTVVTAIVAVIDVLVKIITKLIDFGKWVADGVVKIGKFATAVGDKVGEAIGFITNLPGDAKDALGDLVGTLKQKGKDLIQGLIDGIVEKIEVVKEKIRAALQWIRDHLPGSPIKRGPLKPWNNTGPTGPGGRLMGLLADGISNDSSIDSAMRRITSRIAVAAPGVQFGIDGPTGAAAAGGATFNVYETQNPSATARQIERHLAFAGGS